MRPCGAGGQERAHQPHKRAPDLPRAGGGERKTKKKQEKQTRGTRESNPAWRGPEACRTHVLVHRHSMTSRSSMGHDRKGPPGRRRPRNLPRPPADGNKKEGEGRRPRRAGPDGRSRRNQIVGARHRASQQGKRGKTTPTAAADTRRMRDGWGSRHVPYNRSHVLKMWPAIPKPQWPAIPKPLKGFLGSSLTAHARVQGLVPDSPQGLNGTSPTAEKRGLWRVPNSRMVAGHTETTRVPWALP